ncbi:hypothetical protein BCR33DRAFT_712521 [Rhizoclosmatium globosum]|uniref:DAGKc domain-containing protein n=1 Tax=Rhizoclosmatium globosum TaxID=329046 RepID=A0A1Y2CYR1_9FUNG|nr:hypothetical protein BCR33DRAFT_712521 [Rhizoclosmatium globosum]|eukprot:ORY51475.1 hypothetical protein BCR33DRAFT_712521 [Rhizoclosmatium globosum]
MAQGSKVSLAVSVLSRLSASGPSRPRPRPPTTHSVPARLVFAATTSDTSSENATGTTTTRATLHFLVTATFPPTKEKPPTRTSATFEFASSVQYNEAMAAFKRAGIACPQFDAQAGLAPRKPVYFFVNPFGGVKEAVKIFDSLINPMLETAGIPFERLDTQFKGHAEEVVQKVDYTKYSALVAVSGDGVLHEVVNGIMSRRDWRAARTVPIGTIGAGSSNAMNPNLGHHFPEYGILSIIKNTTRPMDIISITFHESRKVVYSHLNMAWTYIADLDIESDQFRWMGREKTTLSALNRLFRLRKYRANIGILPLDLSPRHDQDLDPTKLDPIQTDPTDTTTFYGPTRYFTHNHAATDQTTFPLQITPAQTPLYYFTANNLPYISSTFKASNNVTMASSCMEVTYNSERKVSRMGMIQSLLNERVPDDLKAMGVTSVQARAFRLDPLGWGWGMHEWKRGSEEVEKGKLIKDVGGHIAISGEPYSMESVTVEAHDKMINMICASWLDED